MNEAQIAIIMLIAKYGVPAARSIWQTVSRSGGVTEEMWDKLEQVKLLEDYEGEAGQN